MGISLWVENESPYQSDLNDLNGNLPMSWEWKSLSKWLRIILWESPYESIESVPMEVTWDEPYGKVPFKMMRID